MKARNFWLLDVQRRKKNKKTEDNENVFFKAFAKIFLLTSKVVHGQPSLKWT